MKLTRFKAGSGRVVLNTTVTWMRIIGVALAKLLTIRFLLSALGVEGFGVFFAVSSVALLTAFLTGAIQTMSLRAISLEAPKGDDMQVVFSNLFGMHLITSVTMLLLGGIVGYMLINLVMNIPPSLLDDANFVFFCIFSATVAGNIFSLYEAFLQSKERFEVFAILDVVQTWILVPVSFWLMFQDGELVKIYAGVVAILTFFGFWIAAFITVRNYPETRLIIDSLFSLEFMRRHISIASWSLVGAVAAVARTQGVVILVNLVGGPSANAIYAVANQIPSVLRQFASTFQLVLAPRIYGKEAIGEREQMIGSVFAVCRLASVLTLIAAIPVAFEMQALLQFWLGDHEQLTVIVSLLLLVALVFEQLAAGTGLAHLALGRVARFNIIAGGLSIMMLPAAYVVTQLSDNFLHILYILILFNCLVAATKVQLLYPEIENPTAKWVSQTLVPVFIFSAPPLLTLFIVTEIIPSSLGRFLLTVTISLPVSLLSAFFLGMNKFERDKLTSVFSSRRTAL